MNMGEVNFEKFIRKGSKRVRTLLIPYLLVSLYGLLLYYVLQSIPFTAKNFSNRIVVDYSAGELLKTLLLNSIPYQLWFIRDLMALVLFSPLLYLLLKRIGFAQLFLFMIVWIFDADLKIFYGESLFFFTLGAFIAVKNVDMEKIGSNWKICFFMWVFFALARTFFLFSGNAGIAAIICLKISVICGIYAIWGGYDSLLGGKDIKKYQVYSLFKYTFFIYLFHEPVLTVFKRIMMHIHIFGKNCLTPLFAYIFSPVITLFLVLFVAKTMRKFTPRIYYLITGGR